MDCASCPARPHSDFCLGCEWGAGPRGERTADWERGLPGWRGVQGFRAEELIGKEDGRWGWENGRFWAGAKVVRRLEAAT